MPRPCRLAWTKNEDDALQKHVQENGACRWRKAAELLPGRDWYQCSSRWFLLDPSLKRNPITKAEGNTIIQLRAKLGPKWSAIAPQLSRRPDQVKSWYRRYQLTNKTENVPQSTLPPSLAQHASDQPLDKRATPRYLSAQPTNVETKDFAPNRESTAGWIAFQRYMNAIQQLHSIASRSRWCLPITELQRIFAGLEEELLALIVLQAVIESEASKAMMGAIFNRRGAVANAIDPTNRPSALSLRREPNVAAVPFARHCPTINTCMSCQRPKVRCSSGKIDSSSKSESCSKKAANCSSTNCVSLNSMISTATSSTQTEMLLTERHPQHGTDPEADSATAARKRRRTITDDRISPEEDNAHVANPHAEPKRTHKTAMSWKMLLN